MNVRKVLKAGSGFLNGCQVLTYTACPYLLSFDFSQKSLFKVCYMYSACGHDQVSIQIIELNYRLA
jgi:hypothetical protein